MKPWVLIDTAVVPGGGLLRLLRRDTEFSMRLGEVELMGSRSPGSERALAALGCAKLTGRDPARVLIGGLGMGFTLRATLDLLGARAEIVVAELIPAVVAWGRGPMASLVGPGLADPRVTIREDDVGRIIEGSAAEYDAILLDVDNGPAGLTRRTNHALYGLRGLSAAYAALRPGGVMAVWSAWAEPSFTLRLRQVGFAVQENAVRAQGSRGARHAIWAAERPSSQRQCADQRARPADRL